MADRNIHELAAFFKEEIDKIELTHEQAGKKADIDRMTVDRLLEGESKKGPFFFTVEALSKSLGFDLSYVLRKEDSTKVDLDPVEFERLRKYRSLTPEHQRIIDEIVESFYENEKNSIKNSIKEEKKKKRKPDIL